MRKVLIVVLAVSLAGCMMARRRNWERADCAAVDPVQLETDSQACLVTATAALGGAFLTKDRLYRQCMMGNGYRDEGYCAR